MVRHGQGLSTRMRTWFRTGRRRVNWVVFGDPTYRTVGSVPRASRHNAHAAAQPIPTLTPSAPLSHSNIAPRLAHESPAHTTAHTPRGDVVVEPWPRIANTPAAPGIGPAHTHTHSAVLSLRFTPSISRSLTLSLSLSLSTHPTSTQAVAGLVVGTVQAVRYVVWFAQEIRGDEVLSVWWNRHVISDAKQRCASLYPAVAEAPAGQQVRVRASFRLVYAQRLM